MSLSVGLPPRHPRSPSAWRDALPGLRGVSGPSEEVLLERLRSGEVDAVAVAVAGPGAVPAGAPGEAAAGHPGLVVGAVPPRPEPRDLLLPAEGVPTLATLPAGARVALAGARRRALLAAHRPDLEAVDLPDRPEETVGPFLRGGGADAAVLAAHEARVAGLSDAASEILEPKAWLPAPGQGASLLLVRAEDAASLEALEPLHRPATLAALSAEASLAPALELGADAPLGALALPYGRWLRLWAILLSGDGRRAVRADLSGSDRRPRALGREVAALLLERGAGLLPEPASARTAGPRPGMGGRPAGRGSP